MVAVVEAAAEVVGLGAVHEAKRGRPEMVGLRGEPDGVAMRGQADDFHALGQVVGHPGRALTDGAGGSQDDDAAFSHARTS